VLNHRVGAGCGGGVGARPPPPHVLRLRREDPKAVANPKSLFLLACSTEEHDLLEGREGGQGGSRGVDA
jgi:hypothetical protein